MERDLHSSIFVIFCESVLICFLSHSFLLVSIHTVSFLSFSFVFPLPFQRMLASGSVSRVTRKRWRRPARKGRSRVARSSSPQRRRRSIALLSGGVLFSAATNLATSAEKRPRLSLVFFPPLRPFGSKGERKIERPTKQERTRPLLRGIEEKPGRGQGLSSTGVV